MRRLVLALLCLSALPAPASATEGASRVGSTGLAGECAYVGVTTVNGRIQFAFGGSVESYSSDPTRQPQATQAVCRLESPTQVGVPGSEPTYSQTTSIARAGAVAPTPPTLTVPLQLRPVQICVSGFGVYGPNTEGNPRYLPEICSVNALRAADRHGGGGGAGAGTQAAGFIIGCVEWNTGVACV